MPLFAKFLPFIRRLFGLQSDGASISFTVELPTFHTEPKKPMSDKEKFIAELKPIALEIEKAHGIPWALTVAQAAHESRYGQSDLTKQANNLFGMTGDSWERKGLPVVRMSTSEYLSNKWIKVMRPFRKYDSYRASVLDWLDVIKRVHPNAYHAACMGDALRFFTELQKSGYATDPTYALKLDKVRAQVEGLA